MESWKRRAGRGLDKLASLLQILQLMKYFTSYKKVYIFLAIFTISYMFFPIK